LNGISANIQNILERVKYKERRILDLQDEILKNQARIEDKLDKLLADQKDKSN
jgi:hypothetical protein